MRRKVVDANDWLRVGGEGLVCLICRAEDGSTENNNEDNLRNDGGEGDW